MPTIDRDKSFKVLKDFYAHHIHSSFHEDQMLAQVGDTPDEDRPLPRWIEEATMDDEEWMELQYEKLKAKRDEEKKSNK